MLARNLSMRYVYFFNYFMQRLTHSDVLSLRCTSQRQDSILTHTGMSSVSLIFFSCEDLPCICELSAWKTGCKIRIRYRCEPLTATCFVLHLLASPCRYRAIESMFCRHTFTLREVFWEVAQHAHDGLNPLVTPFHAGLMLARAGTCASCIHGDRGCAETLCRVLGRNQDLYGSARWYVYCTTVMLQWP